MPFYLLLRSLYLSHNRGDFLVTTAPDATSTGTKKSDNKHIKFN